MSSFQINIDVVDIDPTIVTIATDHFQFKPDDRLRVHVNDGLQFIAEENKKGEVKKMHSSVGRNVGILGLVASLLDSQEFRISTMADLSMYE